MATRVVLLLTLGLLSSHASLCGSAASSQGLVKSGGQPNSKRPGRFRPGEWHQLYYQYYFPDGWRDRYHLRSRAKLVADGKITKIKCSNSQHQNREYEFSKDCEPPIWQRFYAKLNAFSLHYRYTKRIPGRGAVVAKDCYKNDYVLPVGIDLVLRSQVTLWETDVFGESIEACSGTELGKSSKSRGLYVLADDRQPAPLVDLALDAEDRQFFMVEVAENKLDAIPVAAGRVLHPPRRDLARETDRTIAKIIGFDVAPESGHTIVWRRGHSTFDGGQVLRPDELGFDLRQFPAESFPIRYFRKDTGKWWVYEPGGLSEVRKDTEISMLRPKPGSGGTSQFVIVGVVTLIPGGGIEVQVDVPEATE